MHWAARAGQVGAAGQRRRHRCGPRGAGDAVGRRPGRRLRRGALQRLAAHLRFVRVRAAQRLILQDEPGDFMLVVLDGSVTVEHITGGPRVARLAEARPGDVLGEMALLDAGPRASDCTTRTACLLAVLETEALLRLMREDPQLALVLLAALARRLSLRLRQVSTRLSALLTDVLRLCARRNPDGTRPGIEIRQRPAAADGRPQRLGPVPHRRLPARHQGRRQDHQGQPAAADRPAHAAAGARGDERQAGRRVRAHEGVQLRDLAVGHRPLPRQRLHAAGPRRPGLPHDSADPADHRRAGPAHGAEGRGDVQARPGDLRRRHRLGQEHLAGGDGRLPQRKLLRPHHHHRGPGGVRAPAQELHRHAARGGHRHRRLGAGAEEHAAPGARRHPDGRDPRPRDDGARRGLRRDRPPVHGHAARQQRQPGAGPRHQLLPRRAARAAADGPVAEPEGAGQPAPDAAPGRPRPRRGGRDHAEHAADRRPDLQGRGQRDQGTDEAQPRARHADLRPEPVRPLRRQRHHLRRRAAQRRLGERPAAADQAQQHSARAAQDLAAGTEHMRVV